MHPNPLFRSEDHALMREWIDAARQEPDEMIELETEF